MDTSVFVAGMLNPRGGSGELLRLWRSEALFEVIASKELFEELLATLRKPKLGGRFEAGEPERAVSGLAHMAEMLEDDANPAAVTRDVNDDYLVSLAVRARADALVTLDDDLLVLRRLEWTDDSTGDGTDDGANKTVRVIPVVQPGTLLGWLREAGLR